MLTALLALILLLKIEHSHSLRDDVVVSVGSIVNVVDARYISFVIDTASLQINPPGIFPTYPYPVNLNSTLLRSFASAIGPSFFVMTSGAANCITYDQFQPSPNHRTDEPSYMSEYCKGKEYYGSLTPALFDSLLDFAHDINTSFVWHFNMAFGRGYSPTYEPWDPTPALGLFRAAAERIV